MPAAWSRAITPQTQPTRSTILYVPLPGFWLCVTNIGRTGCCKLLQKAKKVGVQFASARVDLTGDSTAEHGFTGQIFFLTPTRRSYVALGTPGGPSSL